MQENTVVPLCFTDDGEGVFFVCLALPAMWTGVFTTFLISFLDASWCKESKNLDFFPALCLKALLLELSLNSRGSISLLLGTLGSFPELASLLLLCADLHPSHTSSSPLILSRNRSSITSVDKCHLCLELKLSFWPCLVSDDTRELLLLLLCLPSLLSAAEIWWSPCDKLPVLLWMSRKSWCELLCEDWALTWTVCTFLPCPFPLCVWCWCLEWESSLRCSLTSDNTLCNRHYAHSHRPCHKAIHVMRQFQLCKLF